jgi:ELWxxDGT repeat protein
MSAWRGVLVSVVVGLVGCGPALEQDGAAALEAEGGALVQSSLWEVCSDEPLRVRDIHPGAASSEPLWLVEDAQGQLLFSADDGQRGRELWVSAGKDRYTARLKDIRPGEPGSAPAHLTRLNRWVLFVADDGHNGPELWRTDGTARGTELVKDIRPGTAGSSPGRLTRVGSHVYFTADDGRHGIELWRTDGTARGTVLVHDFEPNGSTHFESLTAWEDQLALVTLHPSGAVSLWAVDRRERVRQLFHHDLANVLELTPAGRQLFFLVEDADTFEGTLWVTRDPRRTAEPLRHFPGARPMDLTALGDSVYFVAGGEGYFGQPGDPEHGSELWGSDGTVVGTRLVRDIQRGPDGAFHSEATSWMVAVGNTLYFAADDGELGRELWSSNGKEWGTALVKDIAPGKAASEPERLTGDNGVLFFSASTQGRGREAWYSHGKFWNTRPVYDVAPGAASSDPAGFTRAGGYVFFHANDGVSGVELWAAPFRPLESCGYD